MAIQSLATDMGLPAGMTRSRRRMIAFAVALSAVLTVMEATVVSAVLPAVTRDLGGLQLYRWVAAGYMLATAVLVPVYGRLADVYGRRPTYFCALILFLVGSAASGAAPTIQALIAFRVFQGLGAGGVQVVATTILADIYPPIERARVQSAMSVIWGAAAAAGPLIGAAILQFASWRWAFYINVPIGIVVWLLIRTNYVESHTPHRHRFDVLGFLLLSAGIVGLLLSAGEHLSLAGLAASLVVLTVFVLQERRAKEPLVPLHIVWRSSVRFASAGVALISASTYGFITYLPLYVSLRAGGNANTAGLVLTPLLIGIFLGSLAGGRLAARFSLRTLSRGGLVLATSAASVNVALIFGDASPLWTRVAIFFFGLGYIVATLALMLTVLAAASHSERGTSTAAFTLARSLGIALGVGLLGSLLVAPGQSGTVTDAAAMLAPLRQIFAASAGLALLALLAALRLPILPGADPSPAADEIESEVAEAQLAEL